MGISIIQIQEQVIIDTIENITRGDWKVLVLDETSKKIIYNVVKEDDILNKNIANIELIEERREMNPTMDAIYILSPQPHIVDCLLADLDRKRYRRAFLVWTSVLDPKLQQRIDGAPAARQQIAGFDVLSIDFFPRESHLVTFRDPWSFPILFHPGCNDLVRQHMEDLAQKIASVCIAAGEYPKVRYYRPKNPIHEASVLCTHLARFVQQQLDDYARWNRDFPPQTNRPPGILVITDRSMDIMAPLVHEFTYQAMAHDLLPIKDGDKTTFHVTFNEGEAGQEEKDMELQEKDTVWVDNRHRHMKDTIDKLMGDFQKFLDQNPHFTNDKGDATNLNAIRDMLAGLPQFQEMKEAYSLHLTMAQECMNKFQNNKLPDVASAEQTLATGLDEDYRKPRNILDQVARLLDDESITTEDRLRLIMLYVLYRNGVIPEDINRLLAHSNLPKSLFNTIVNLELLGGRPVRGLKETVQPQPPVFPPDPKGPAQNGNEEEYSLSRFHPTLRTLLDNLCRGQLDPLVFPYVNPPLDPNGDAMLAQNSLRAAKPSWADANRRVPDNRQRIFVYVAGGATFSEARACYEASAKHNRDIVLATSHMLTPHLFCRQIGDLSANPRQLDIPLSRPKPKAPAHLFEREAPTPPPQQQAPAQGQRPAPGGAATGRRQVGGAGVGGIPSGPRPPVQQMGAMTLSSGGGAGVGRTPAPSVAASGGSDGKLHKADKDKKKRNIFGLKK
ncbi:syntaxin-binding protein 1 [Sporothrix brasiliensis 5110]|uniref:Syntaxin-binding protein 1 n=1 Tax=Sporothrix brasiliensis 5110 TaxID=1398154 RepID=A0A0C2ITP1_9PEZI|nr:syntaxin-binding protein 1 [Sporothrix brasiliensis 5110]KIH90135.1 syntaxin-binding protein 1 [Sporothrix brasiliensis 5110]